MNTDIIFPRPSASPMAHRPTPHTIALAALISLHCQEESPLYQDCSADFSEVDSFLQHTLLKCSSKSWSSLHGQRVHNLLQQLERDVSESIATQFRVWLTIASSNIDALIDLMTTIRRGVFDGSVDAASANGIFLRSCSLGFDELSFESVAVLWKDFQTEILDEDGACQQNWTLSPEQMEGTVLEQCLISTSLKGADFDEMQANLQRVLDHNPELPAAHFLRFLLCLQSGERVGAMDALHQYMDYALTVDGGEDILQFAAILKAALHQEFGEHQLVASATEESVRVAQQSQDAGAVAFALGWLAVHDKKLMQRCVQRAGNVRPLVAGANLSLAVATHSWTAHTHALTDPVAADAISAFDRPTHLGRFDGNAAARQKLVAAGLWNHFGEISLSAQASVSALSCHCDQLTAADVVVAIQNLCFAPTPYSNTTASRLLLPDSSYPSIECIYGNAIRTYILLREKYQLPVDGVFLLEVAIVLHEWAVRRGDLDHAEALMAVVESHLHPRVENFQAVVLDVVSQRALLLSRQGRWDDAKELLKNLIAKCKVKANHGATARLLLQLSEVQLEANQKQFANALRPLLECLALSKKHKMDGLHSTALSVLAQVHLRMGRCSRAVSVLQSSLPALLRQGHVWKQAEAYLTLAKCRMKQAKECDYQSKRNKLLLAAVQELTRSEDLFLRCQDCRHLQEVYYLLARLHSLLPGSHHLRDIAAENFAQLTTRSAPSPIGAFMSALTSRDGLMRLVDRPGPVVIPAM